MAAEITNPYSPPDDALALEHTSAFAGSVLIFAAVLVLSVRTFRATVYLAVISPWEVVRDVATWLTPDILGVSWAMTRPFLLLTLVSFCFWIYRTNRDARALGAVGMSFTPAWAVWVGFIPVVNLIGPYRAVREVYQASSGEDDVHWREERVPWALPVWWGLWIGSVAWNLVPYATLTASSAVWGQAILEVLRAAAAFLLIVVVRSVERRLAARDAGAGAG